MSGRGTVTRDNEGYWTHARFSVCISGFTGNVLLNTGNGYKPLTPEESRALVQALAQAIAAAELASVEIGA